MFHNLKLDKKSLYLTTFACPYGRYKFTRLQCGVGPQGDMFQEKINKIFKDLSSRTCRVDDILIVGYNIVSRVLDRTMKQVIQICHRENLKLNKNKCHLRYTTIPFFGEVISREGVQPDAKKLHMQRNASPNN